MNQLTFFAEEPPARIIPLPDSASEWLAQGGSSPSHLLKSLHDIGPTGWFGRTSPVSCHQTADGTLAPSSGSWQNSGMGSPTAFLTLSTSEWNHTLAPSLKDDGVCSLSDILEDSGSVPQRYFLSAKACAGILRRAEKRGKELPPQLALALRAVAALELTSTAMAG